MALVPKYGNRLNVATATACRFAAVSVRSATLRDWEQGRTEPDQLARTYLKVIAGDPAGIGNILRRHGAGSIPSGYLVTRSVRNRDA
jgi:hypothetical protein